MARSAAAAAAGAVDVSVRASTLDDLAFVMAAERAPDNAPFVLQWPRERHVEVTTDLSCAHWIVEQGGRPAGYLILLDLFNPHGSLQFRRLVVTEKGRGIGRAAVRLVKAAAFERYGAHRLWLDVMEHNRRAQALYASEGFVREGTLRECVRVGGRFVSLHLMSILNRERARERRRS
jgi:RimJ/RimL family protein N-acetyltransferase